MIDPIADNDDERPYSDEIRSFGRRRGRKPGPRQQRLWDERLPDLAVDLTMPLAAQLTSSPHSQLWLEIGFGGAEHLLWHARRTRRRTVSIAGSGC